MTKDHAKNEYRKKNQAEFEQIESYQGKWSPVENDYASGERILKGITPGHEREDKIGKPHCYRDCQKEGKAE